MSLDPSWLQTIDRIVMNSIAEQERIVGLTSPEEGDGVGMLARQLARSFALSQVETLLIQLSGERLASGSGTAGGEGWIPLQAPPGDFISRDEDGFGLLVSRPDGDNRFIFNNIDRIRQILDEELGNYGAIILDLPAIKPAPSDLINAASCAAACDAVYLVCQTGRTSRGALADGRDRLQAAKAPLKGLILDEREHTPTHQSMADFLRKWRLFPGARSLANRLEKMDYLG